MIRTEGLSKNIPPYQAVHTVMYLNPSRFPGKLHLLPAGSFDPVVFYQQVGGKHACNAAHSGIADFTASHHRMPDDLILRKVWCQHSLPISISTPLDQSILQSSMIQWCPL